MVVAPTEDYVQILIQANKEVLLNLVNGSVAHHVRSDPYSKTVYDG
jgi:hypothetical protein